MTVPLTPHKFLGPGEVAKRLGVTRMTLWRNPERYKPDIYITNVPITAVLDGADPMTDAQPAWCPDGWNGPTVFFSLRSLATAYNVSEELMRRHAGPHTVEVGTHKFGWDASVTERIPTPIPNPRTKATT